MGRRIQGPLPTEMQIALVRGCDSTEARLPVKRIATMFLFAWLGSKRSGCSGPDQRSPECVRLCRVTSVRNCGHHTGVHPQLS
jgi:hypothetical protein